MSRFVCAAALCVIGVSALAGEPRALRTGDIVHTKHEYPVGGGKSWSGGPFVLLRPHDKPGWVWVATVAGETACIDTHLIDWAKSPLEREVLAGPKKTEPSAEWHYVPLHGGNGRLVKIRQHRTPGGESVEIDQWTYEGVTNGRGPLLYVRAEKLGAVLEAVAERLEAQEKRK